MNIDDGNVYELFNGKLYLMSSPSKDHQAISTEILRQLGNFLIGKECEVTHDFNVKLNEEEDTVCIPDILVICDKSKYGNNVYEGAPDFIIEIASPSNAYRDYLEKLNAYRRAGVKEYWIIDPEHKKVFVNLLVGNEYRLSEYAFEEVPITVLTECNIDLSRFQ